ncbi:MAG: plastocyanin/azurin family copper-binding protein [Gemmatimonadota bacterium]
MSTIRVRVFFAAAAAAALGSGLVAACSGGGGNGGTGPGPTTGSVVASVAAGGTNVQGAQLSITGGAAATTGSNGQARWDNLQPGAYTVTLSQLPAGFAMGTETAGKSASVAAGGTATVSWSVQSSGGAQNAVVTTSAASFSPAAVTIPAGGTVRFQYGSGVGHTVTPETPSGSWTERDLASASDNFEVTFSTPGTYRFRCRPHSTSFTSGMVGVVTVT